MAIHIPVSHYSFTEFHMISKNSRTDALDLQCGPVQSGGSFYWPRGPLYTDSDVIDVSDLQMWDGKLQGGTHLTANMSLLQTKMHILEVMEYKKKKKHFFQPLKI